MKTDSPSSPGALLRRAVAEESPLQIPERSTLSMLSSPSAPVFVQFTSREAALLPAHSGFPTSESLRSTMYLPTYAASPTSAICHSLWM